MKFASFLASLIALTATQQALAQDADTQQENNGTDPTRLTTTAEVFYEYGDLRQDFQSHTVTFGLTVPIGSQKRTSIRIRAPLASVDVAGDNNLGMGDLSLRVVTVPVVTRSYGIALTGEIIFDTASRPELGSGKTIVKPTFIYAKFLRNRAIFAPSVVHSQSIAGKDSRKTVSVTTIDLYYVPHFKNRNIFMTLDPAMNFDWKANKEYPSLSVTAGTKIGHAFGGSLQIYAKPTVLFGNDRPANWKIEAGLKVLNF